MVLGNQSPARASRHTLVLVAAFITLLSACSLPFPTPTLSLTPPSDPNPPWPQQCPLRIALVVDLSDSMDSNLDTVAQSVGDLIEALGAESLDGVPNEVAVVVFGSTADVAVPMTNVSDDNIRNQIRQQVGNLGTTRGSTDWEAALTTARGLQPDIVFLLTDGAPDSLSSAVAAANALKSDGTRVVGLGIGLHSSRVDNLVAVTGPVAEDDFYQTSSSGLLSKLFEAAAKACGTQVGPVPAPALPAPAPAPTPPPTSGSFPLVPVLAAGVLAVLAAVVGGLLLSRRRSDFATRTTPAPYSPPGSTISPEPPASTSTFVAKDDDPTTADPVGSTAEAERPTRAPRRVSLARFQDPESPHRPGNETSGSGGTST